MTTTLSKLLRRGHLRIASAVVLLFGTLLTLIGQQVLGTAQERHLELVARTVGYSVEAAVMFRDPEAARDVLREIALRERLSEVRVVLADGQLFAAYQPPGGSELGRLVRHAGRILMRDHAAAPIQLADGRHIATVTLRGDGIGLVWLLVYGVAAGLLCVIIALVAATVMTRRLERSLVDPINQLTALTRSIRTERAFGRRAPAVRIAELQALSDDFNAMLDEVRTREAELVAHQKKLQSDNATLSHRAAHDKLTGLANRSRFENRLQEALTDVRLHGGKLGVLFLDADGFKAVNDTAGHAAGDQLLVQMAERLRQAVRESDIVARLGGDEFAVLLHPLRSVDDARRIGDKISQAMQAPFDLGEFGCFRCGLSIGMATFPLDGDTMPALLDTADREMYRAKHAGRRARHSQPEDRQ